MSPKDLCALPVLDKLVKAGIDCFKIEGRAKGPEYVYAVTKVYREALDAIEHGVFTKKKVASWLEELNSVYNRGFSTNFLLGTPTNDSWAQTYGGMQTHSKKPVGVVSNYYAKKSVADIELKFDSLEAGQTLMFIGPTTGILKVKVEEMYGESQSPVEKGSKGELVSVKVPEIVRKNDKVFVWEEKKMTQEEELIQSMKAHEPFKMTKKDAKASKVF